MQGVSPRSLAVSIHAPWEGCDVEGGVTPADHDFVSIHAPWEGCDMLVVSELSEAVVSIHAPWEGCDLCFTGLRYSDLKFQFTHPGKGATG